MHLILGLWKQMFENDSSQVKLCDAQGPNLVKRRILFMLEVEFRVKSRMSY